MSKEANVYDLSVLLPISAALIHGTGFVLYNVQTKLGKSEPNPVSWFLWAFLATLNALSFRAMSDTVAALQFLTGSVGCLLTFLYVLAIGRFRWPKDTEWAMFIIGMLSIVVWRKSGAMVANMILVGSIIWSFVPTILGVWKDPHNEKPAAWWFWTFASAITAVFTYFFRGGWTASMVMPITLIIAHGTVPLISTENRKRIWLERKQAQLAFVQRQIPTLEKEIQETTNLVRGVVDSAVDRGSKHEQSRRGKRWSEVYDNSTILARLKNEESNLKRELSVK